MSDKVNKVRKPPGKAKFTDAEKIKALKRLEMNGFNLTVTANQLGISTNSLKAWREKYPQAFANKYNERNLAIVEHNAKEKSLAIIDKSNSLIEKALKQADMLLELETDLGKIASFIRAITPLANNIKDMEASKGYSQIASLTSTLEKLARLPGLPTSVEDTPYTEVPDN